MADYYEALKAKWSELQGATPEEKLKELNALKVDGPTKLISIADATNVLRTNGAWYAIKKAADSSLAAFAAVDLVQDMREQNFDPNNAMVQQMGAALVAEGLLKQDQWDEVLALGATKLFWWEANGYKREFDIGDIKEAGFI